MADEYPKRSIIAESFVDQIDMVNKGLIEIKNQPINYYNNNRKYNLGRKYMNNHSNQGYGYNHSSMQPHYSQHQQHQHQLYQRQNLHQQSQMSQSNIQSNSNQNNFNSLNGFDYNSLLYSNDNGSNEKYYNKLNNSNLLNPPVIFDPFNTNYQTNNSNIELSNNLNFKQNNNIWDNSNSNQTIINDATVWG